MVKRSGNKQRLHLNAKRRKVNNFREYNRCRLVDIAYPKRMDDRRNDNAEPISYSINNRFDLVEDQTREADDNPTIDVEHIPINHNESEEAVQIHGRRIVNIQHLFNKLKEISGHNTKYGCGFLNLAITGELKLGLNSRIDIICDMCHQKFKIYTNPDYADDNMLNVNTACVEGIISIGCGFYNLEEFLSSLDIPCMNEKTYRKYHNVTSEILEKTTVLEMEKAANEERDIALQQGNIDENGTPCITVVADGCWSKRSYHNNYSASSGAAAIIGAETGKILYLGVKNKFCITCIKAEFNDKAPKAHPCFKNFEGSSSNMESAVIIEGFCRSMEMYNIKYTKLIADGDSSTYKKILDCRPYHNTTVEKIECRNHLLRNYCMKLRKLSVDTVYPLKSRKYLTMTKILKLRIAVTSAIRYRKQQTGSFSDKICNLKKDIDNSVFHIFGEHLNCADYYCNHQQQEENIINHFKSTPNFFSRLKVIVCQLSQHSRSLIYDVDSNVVEQFNSKIAKYVGGKRINFTKSRSYRSRCLFAVLNHNTRKPHFTLHRASTGKNPSNIKSKFEENRIVKSRKKLQYSWKKKKNYSSLVRKDPDYGVHCQKPDMSEVDFEEARQQFLESLQKTDEERKEFEMNTSLQSGSGLWLEQRRKMITASNFYSVCVRSKSISCVNLVKKLLYNSQDLLQHLASICHGRENENRAKTQLARQVNKTITPCGLFIDKQYPFLGASPDGVISDDIIIEIKCPYSAFNKPIDEAILQRKITFWKTDGSVNLKHSWYYQVQGQLHISNRKVCILAVWTSSSSPLKIQYIERDDKFWDNKMQNQLINFYNDCLLPELVDPRHTRSMKIRDPDYIVEAIKQKEIKKKKK